MKVLLCWLFCSVNKQRDPVARVLSASVVFVFMSVCEHNGRCCVPMVF